jgi:hypothetical protein
MAFLPIETVHKLERKNCRLRLGPLSRSLLLCLHRFSNCPLLQRAHLHLTFWHFGCDTNYTQCHGGRNRQRSSQWFCGTYLVACSKVQQKDTTRAAESFERRSRDGHCFHPTTILFRETLVVQISWYVISAYVPLTDWANRP